MRTGRLANVCFWTPLGHCRPSIVDIHDHAELHVDEVVVRVGERMPVLVRPFHWAAGSDGETNFGTTSVGAPSGRVVKGRRCTPSPPGWWSPDRDPCQSRPAIERYLLASAWICDDTRVLRRTRGVSRDVVPIFNHELSLLSVMAHAAYNEKAVADMVCRRGCFSISIRARHRTQVIDSLSIT